MENGSLSGIIKQCGPLNEELTAVYVAQVLQGLSYLHEQGVVHRDIKVGGEIGQSFVNLGSIRHPATWIDLGLVCDDT